MKINHTFSKREKVIIAITGVLAISAVVMTCVIEPLRESIKRLDSEIKKKRSLVSEQAYLIEHGNDIDSLRNEYKEVLRNFTSHEEITEYFFTAVKQLAVKRGLSVRRVAPLASAREKALQQAFLEIELEGEFRAIARIINDIEHSPALIRITSLTIRSSRRASKELHCRMSLTKVFF